MGYEPLKPGFLDQVFNSTIGLPQQLVWRIIRAMEDDEVDLFSEKGIFDAALIPGFGMLDSHEHDVMPDYMAEQMGMANAGESGFGSQLGAAILSDPLTYMTGGLTAVGKLGKAATLAKNSEPLKKVLRTAAKSQKKDIDDYAHGLSPQQYSGHIDEAIEAATEQAAKEGTSRSARRVTYLEKMKRKFDDAIPGAERLHQNNHLKDAVVQGPTPGLTMVDAIKTTRDRQIAIGLPILSRWGAKYDVFDGYSSWWKLYKDSRNSGGTAIAKALMLNKMVEGVPGAASLLRNTTAPFRHFRGGFKIGHEAEVALKRQRPYQPDELDTSRAWVTNDGAAREVANIHKAADREGGRQQLIKKLEDAYVDGINNRNLSHEDAFKHAFVTLNIAHKKEAGSVILGRLRGQGNQNIKFPKWGAGTARGKAQFEELVENAVAQHGKASELTQRGASNIVTTTTENKALADIFQTERSEKLNHTIGRISESAFEKGRNFKQFLSKTFGSGTGISAGDKEYAQFLSHVARDNDELEQITKSLYNKLGSLAGGAHGLSLKDMSTIVSKIIELDALPGEIVASFKAAELNPELSSRVLKSMERFLNRQRHSLNGIKKIFKRKGFADNKDREKLLNAFNDEIFPFLERESSIAGGEVINSREIVGQWSKLVESTAHFVTDFSPRDLKRLRRGNNKHLVLGMDLPITAAQRARQATGEAAEPDAVLSRFRGRQAGTLTDDELADALKEISWHGQRSLTDAEVVKSAGKMEVVTAFAERNKISIPEAIALVRKTGRPKTRKVDRTVKEQVPLWSADKTKWTSQSATDQAAQYGFRLELRDAVDALGEPIQLYHLLPTGLTLPQWKGYLNRANLPDRGLYTGAEKAGPLKLRRGGPPTKAVDHTPTTQQPGLGFRSISSAMESLHGFLRHSPAYAKKFGPELIDVKRPLKIATKEVSSLKKALAQLPGSALSILRGKHKIFDDAKLPGALRPDWVRLNKLQSRRALPESNKLHDRVIRGKERKVTTDPGRPRSGEELKIALREKQRDPSMAQLGLEVNRNIDIPEAELGDWVIQYARGRMLVREVQQALKRSAKTGAAVEVDPRIMADLQAHIGASGALVRDIMESHLPAEFSEAMNLAQRINGATFHAAQRSGVWLPGSPIAYLPRFFNKAARARISSVMGDIASEDGSLLTRLGVKQAQYYKRSWNELTIDDLNELHAALREAMLEKTASPLMAKWHKQLDDVMEEAGVGVSGLYKKMPWTKKERIESDPFLGLLQRLGVAAQDKNLENYFNNMLVASTGKNGDSLMLGGKVVGIIDDTGNVHNIPRQIYPIKSTKRTKKGGEEVTMSEKTVDEEFTPKGILIELPDGTTHQIENNLFKETGFSVLPFISDFAQGDITAEMIPGFKPSIGNSFARASMRSDLLNKMHNEPLSLHDAQKLMGKNVVVGSRNNITATVKSAAKVHEVTAPAIRTFDAINYGIKSFQTIFRLPFHIANLSSGVFQAHLAGATPKNLVASYWDTMRLLGGNQDFARSMSMVNDMLEIGDSARSLGIVNLAKNLSPFHEGERSLLQDAVRTHGGGELHRFLKSSQGYDKIDDLDSMEHLVIPLSDGSEIDLMEFLQTAGEMQLYGTFASSLTRGSRTIADNLIRIKLNALEPTFGGRLLDIPKNLMTKMANIAETSEVINRTATALALVRGGHTTRRAIEITKEAHVPYEKLTPFERTYLKRVSVYYTFPRHYMPWAWSRFAEDPAKLSSIKNFLRDQNVLTTVEGKPNLVAGDFRVDVGRLNANLEAAGMIAAFADRIAMPAAELLPGVEQVHSRQLRNVYSDAGITNIGGIVGMFAGNNVLPTPGREMPGKSMWEEATRIAWPIKIAAQLAGKAPSKEEESPFVQYTGLEGFLTDTVFGTGARKVRKNHELIRAQMAYRGQLKRFQLRIAATDDPETKARLTGHIRTLAMSLRQIASETEQKKWK